MDKNTKIDVNAEGRGERAQPARGETVGQRGNRRGGLAARLGAVMIRRVPYAVDIIVPGAKGQRDRVRWRYRNDNKYMGLDELVRRSTYNRRKRQTHRRRR